MKKRKFSLLLVVLFIVSMISGCSKAKLVEDLGDEVTEIAKEQIDEAVEVIPEVVEEVTKETEESISEEPPVKVEEQQEKINTDVNDTAIVELEETTWAFDQEKIDIEVELGYPSPYEEIESVSYEPIERDALVFDSTAYGETLYNSMNHKGFTGLEVTYNKKTYEWNDFFGDLECTEFERNITVNLKNENIYEADIIDEFEKNYRYYDDQEGVYYEVSELLLGSYEDKPEDLEKAVFGNACYYDGIKELVAPTYNPFVLQKDEVVNQCMLTNLDDQPVVYIETSYNEELYKKWISIEHGVLIKQLVFTNDGLIKEIKIATGIEEKAIDDSVFYKPEDVDYTDITLLIYSFEGGDLEPLAMALSNTLPKEDFSMVLKNQLDEDLIIHAGGYDGEESLDMPIILSTVTDMNEKELKLRSYNKEGYYYTICDDKKIVEKYNTSVRELKLFDFEQTGFRGIEDNAETISYTFEHTGKAAVSGLKEFYDYEIDLLTNKIVKINIYKKESIKDADVYGEMMEYTIEDVGEADESLFDIPDDYKIIDHGENSHDDGEHVPAWFE